MRPHGDQSARVYRTGSPKGYLVGGALLALAGWFVWEFLHSEYIGPVDRPVMAGIAALTVGGLAVHALLRGAIPVVILDGPTLRIRDWRGRTRVFDLDHLVRMTWSYRYAGGRWAGYDGGRAWLEFEFDDAPGRPAVVDYAGQSRHACVEKLMLDVAARAGLHWDPKTDPLSSTDMPGADVTWRRRSATDGG